MAIETNTPTTAKPAPMTMNQNQASQSSATQSAQSTQPTPWSFHNGSFFSRAPIGRNIGSEALLKLQKAMETVYAASAPQFDVKMVALDNNNEKTLAFSALVVCVVDKTMPTTGVAYYTMVIEGSGEKIPPRFENIGGQQIEITRVTSEAFDSILAREVQKKLRVQYPQQNLINSEGCVIPSGFNHEDAAQVHAVAVNAGMACFTELSTRHPNFTDLNLSMQSKDSTLVVNHRYERKQVTDGVGSPVRSDVQITFQSQQNNGNQAGRSVNDGGRTMKVSQIDGFIDLVWAPAIDVNPYTAYQQQNMQLKNQKYLARFVMTNMENEFLQTLPAYLLSLVTAQAVGRDNNWFNSFKPRMLAPNEQDMYDIGAINLEVNVENNPSGVGAIIDTKSATFGVPELVQLLSSTFRPGLVMSLDVADNGPSSWCTSVFAEASIGNPDATSAIFNAAMQLTNGLFQSHFPAGAPIFVDQGNRIHMGHYEDRNGTKRDIRDIDYLAVLNMLSNDLTTVQDFSNTFNNSGMDINVRLAKRKQIIMGIAQRAEITGFATRVTFSSQFSEALSSAVAAAGFTTRLDNNGGVLQAAGRVGASNIASGLLTGANNSVFSGGQIVTPGFTAQAGYSKWGRF